MPKLPETADNAIGSALMSGPEPKVFAASKGNELEDGIALAAYHRMTAVTYWESAKILNESFESNGQPLVRNRMAIPFYYLIFHSAELLLKCALLKRGVLPDDMKKYPLRHSLGELLKALHGEGIPISDQAKHLIVGLDRQHKDHSLRYSFLMEGAAPIFMPPPQELFALLEELLMAGRISTHGA
jgi:hypothetical protein